MSEYEREIELYDYIEVLLQYKWFILGATLLCGALGWYFRPAPPPALYEAVAVLEVEGAPVDEKSGGHQTSRAGGSYATLAESDEVKKGLIDSLGLGLSIAALDGMLAAAGVSEGLELRATSRDAALPIPLLNGWITGFIAKARLVVAEDRGRPAAHARSEGDVDRIRYQIAELDTTAKKLYAKVISIETAMRSMEVGAVEDELQAGAFADEQRYLASFDRRNGVEKAQAYMRRTGLDSLLGAISNLTAQLSDYAPVLGTGTLQSPNPVYVSIAERLSRARSAYAQRKAQLAEVPKGERQMGDGDLNTVFHTVELRGRLVHWFRLRAEKQKAEASLAAVQRQRDDLRDDLLGMLSTIDQSKVRILSRSLEVRTVPQESGQSKTALAAGVGLLLSAILSLLIEYVRKARKLRAPGAGPD